MFLFCTLFQKNGFSYKIIDEILLGKKDERDNRFLELAHASNADFPITGNKLHFTFSQFNNTQIVSPREYWENYKPKKDD